MYQFQTEKYGIENVSPAKAGVQELLGLRRFLDSGLRRNDEVVSRRAPEDQIVSPAKAGVQELLGLRRFLDSGLRRNDEVVNNTLPKS